MDHYELSLLLDNPTVKLLRAHNASLILSYLHTMFKVGQETALPESHLQATLESQLAEIRGTDPDKYPKSPAEYLSDWCSDGQGFLRRYHTTGADEPYYELTSGAERAFRWLDSLHGSQFVGTESRLEGVFTGLEEIVRNTMTNPDERIKQLEEDIDELRAEIDRIRATGEVRSFTSVQVNERFALLMNSSKELLSDFRQVEENFRRIAREISARQVRPEESKGDIMGHMLDSHDAMRRSEQGQSFIAFWNLLLSIEQQDRFHQNMDRLQQLSELPEQLRRDTILHDLIPLLSREARKVMDSYKQMTGNLRKVLDTAYRAEQHRVATLLSTIRSYATKLRDDPPQTIELLDIEDSPEFFATMGRPLWSAPSSPISDRMIQPSEVDVKEEDLIRFQDLPHIELQQLSKNLDDLLRGQDNATLQEVIDRFPPKYGMMEVLGYLMIAASEEGHLMHEEEEVIQVPPHAHWSVPRVTFTQQ